jgi:hypothetical protein
VQNEGNQKGGGRAEPSVEFQNHCMSRLVDESWYVEGGYRRMGFIRGRQFVYRFSTARFRCHYSATGVYREACEQLVMEPYNIFVSKLGMKLRPGEWLTNIQSLKPQTHDRNLILNMPLDRSRVSLRQFPHDGDLRAGRY